MRGDPQGWGACQHPHWGTFPGCLVRGKRCPERERPEGRRKGSEKKGFSTESRQPFVQGAWMVRKRAALPG